MNTLFNNKVFITLSCVFVALLSLFFIVLGIYKVKEMNMSNGFQSAMISVSGVGEVNAVPDIAKLSFSISKDGKTSKEAQDFLNEQLTKTLSYLKEQKIEDKDIKSEYGGVTPKYDTIRPCYDYKCPNQEAKIIGYVATQTITIKVRAVDTANDVRTGLTTLGITDVSGPNFSIDDEELLKDEARGLAIKDAQEKAEVLADQLGVKLGKITSFSDNNSVGYPMAYESSMMMKTMTASAPAPVLPKGENKITSNITITYEIR